MVGSKPLHTRCSLALVLALVVTGALVPLSGTAVADHPSNSCLDVTAETATDDIGNTQTITAAIRGLVPPADATGSCRGSAVPVDTEEGLIINFEMAGPNDDDGADTPGTPDVECTIPVDENTCEFVYQGTSVGTDTIRGWVNHDRVESTFEGEADTTEGRNELNAPGGGDDICTEGAPVEPDCTDVVARTWEQRGDPTLDCDDSGPPDTEREINPGDGTAASNEVYTCTARNLVGAPVNNVAVRGEVENGVNDPDPGDDASYGIPDYACTTGSDGTCTITVAQSENEQGTAIICFWREDLVPEGGSPASLCSPSGTPPTDPEPTGENQLANGSDAGNDAADQVEKTWQVRSTATGGVDAELEAATNQVGQTHGINATVYDQFGDQFVGNTTVSFEFFQGSPADTGDGNNPNPPDRTCTTNSSATCSITYSSTQPGTDQVCVFINAAPAMQGDSNTGTCGGEAHNDPDDEPGGPDAPEPSNDDQDVVQKTWLGPNAPARLNCDPEIANNPPGSSHTVTCTVLTITNQSATAGALVDAEATGANDPDGSNSMNTPDFTCQTNAQSQCSFTHGPGGVGSTGQSGSTTYRAWIDADNNNATAEADEIEGRDESSQPGLEGEPDDTDVVEKSWGGEARTIDCEPEQDSNPLGSSHTVTCTVRDTAGGPVGGEGVTFTEDGPGTLTTSSQQTTTAQGTVQATTTSQEEGTQSITGTLTDDLSGNEPGDVDECDRAANDPAGAPQGVCSDTVSKTWGPPPPECSDGVDNDGDGKTDFPDDPGCESAQDNDEEDVVRPPKRVGTRVEDFDHGSPFSGDVESKKAKCERRRRVVVKKVTPGSDFKIGRDRSSRSGRFKVGHGGRPHGDGKFYAKVKKKRFTNNKGRVIICKKARSRRITVR